MRSIVFHSGSLGDFVMTWPFLRALVRAGDEVILATSHEKGLLAEAEMNHTPGASRPFTARSIERREWTALWTGQPVAPALADLSMRRVYSFLADPTTPAGALWLSAARSLYPAAEFMYIGPPGSPSRADLWKRTDAARHAEPFGPRPTGSHICIHIGAGSEDKRWPMANWAALVATLARAHPPGNVRLLAGEVEAERLTDEDRSLFARHAGRFITGLADLAHALHASRLYIGADTGPTHLAAQLGVPTLALFGPTDPAVWSPAGPRVRVLAPPAPSPMTWLSADAVAAAAKDLCSPLP